MDETEKLLALWVKPESQLLEVARKNLQNAIEESEKPENKNTLSEEGKAYAHRAICAFDIYVKQTGGIDTRITDDLEQAQLLFLRGSDIAIAKGDIEVGNYTGAVEKIRLRLVSSENVSLLRKWAKILEAKL